MMITVNEIKAYQYVLICKAGLAVCGLKEMTKEQIHLEVLKEFKEAFENRVIPAS